MILMLWISVTQSPQWMIINAYMLLSGSWLCLFQVWSTLALHIVKDGVTSNQLKDKQTSQSEMDCPGLSASWTPRKTVHSKILWFIRKHLFKIQLWVIHKKILKVKCNLQLFHLFTACMSRASLKGVSVSILMRTWTCQTPATGACTLVRSYNFTRETWILFVHFISPAAAQRPCSTNRAAPYRWPSARLHCSATSAPGPGIHLKGETEWDGESQEVCLNNYYFSTFSTELNLFIKACQLSGQNGIY